MHKELIDILIDPIHRQPLQLEPFAVTGDHVITGRLTAVDGRQYQICRGIPRFVLTDDVDQSQTSQSFGFKWKKQDSYGSSGFNSFYAVWLMEKYGFTSISEWTNYFAGRKRILDLGCGSGLSSAPWLDTPDWPGQAAWIGVDISEAIEVASERLGHIPNTNFFQADALHLPFIDGAFDTILSEGVLHHTPSTRLALQSTARVLSCGGEFHFYVYRKKGPVREFTDDYIRQQIDHLSDEAAWEAMRSLTRLAQALAELQTTVVVPEEVPLLGIKAGEHDIQRLIYWNFAKLYWNDKLSFEENLHINFDWYRPRYAHRQSAEEVRAWCEEAGLSIEWFHEQESGFTVRAVKR